MILGAQYFQGNLVMQYTLVLERGLVDIEEAHDRCGG
jgi:hypothetical protein